VGAFVGKRLSATQLTVTMVVPPGSKRLGPGDDVEDPQGSSCAGINRIRFKDSLDL
jgi:hypothetical protein